MYSVCEQHSWEILEMLSKCAHHASRVSGTSLLTAVIALSCSSQLTLICPQELLEDGQMDQFHKALVELNMDSAEELQSYINKLSLSVEQTKQKILQSEVNIEVDVVDSKPEVGCFHQVNPHFISEGIKLLCLKMCPFRLPLMN